jgi:L,D-peptidoglycan transpeptidase YkuD (ErfK/YbiS/YcfS/YnhG family)
VFVSQISVKMMNIMQLIHVKQIGIKPYEGKIAFGNRMMSATLGKNGMTAHKREGDGKTPIGFLKPLWGYYRADRVEKPASELPFYPLKQTDGWCDAPDHIHYNRFISHPFKASAERLWRGDNLYDHIIVLDWNMGIPYQKTPRQKHRGSAIFLHHKPETDKGTEGCIALNPDDLVWLLKRIDTNTVFHIK